MSNIPKILHMYWDKGPMSRLQVFTVETFHKLNLDWEIIVYLPKQVSTSTVKYIPDYTGIDYYYILTSLPYLTFKEVDMSEYGIDTGLHNILMSDILRYHLLYTHGGVWSDFDVIWLKPMNITNTTVCMLNTTTGHHNISVLIAEPKHEFYRDMIQICNTILSKKSNAIDMMDHQEFGTRLLNELYPTLKDVLNKYPDIVGLPYETFFPYSIFNMEKLYKEENLSFINDNVYGIHWFNGHPLSKEYVNNNFYNKGIKCSITTLLNQLNYNE